MEIVVTVLSLPVGLLVTVAIVINLRAFLAARALPALGSVVPDLENWPKVSIVVAACNEAEAIGGAAKTLLQMDYPNLELIIVDDRSTDGTTEIVDELADADRELSFDGADRGEGAVFEWSGDEEAGAGRLTIVESGDGS